MWDKTVYITDKFLFFPVLRRGSKEDRVNTDFVGFYSSPSCDGDRYDTLQISYLYVSILPRLATGIVSNPDIDTDLIVSILPRLATGIMIPNKLNTVRMFLFFPVLRRGSL